MSLKSSSLGAYSITRAFDVLIKEGARDDDFLSRGEEAIILTLDNRTYRTERRR